MQHDDKGGRRAFCAGLSAVLGAFTLAPGIALAAEGRKIPQRPSPTSC